MTLNILFTDGTLRQIEIDKREDAETVVRYFCKWNRLDATKIEDYWIGK